MRILALITLLTVSSLASAASEKPGESKLFKCMDKSTFTISSECMSKDIESNLAFQKVQETVLNTAADASDKAIATMTFDPKTLSIDIVAHRDAYLAKTNIDK